ncbi:MAG: biotin transporter BioY [Pseudobdellovibrionaceae bacterium]
MTQNQALIPQYLILRGNKIIENVVTVSMGVVLMGALAQITIQLPWTPVPITGQTFGVALVSLLWGGKRGLAVMLGYLGAGGLGFPVFAMGGSGISLGPTLGYLLGMTAASYWMGWLSDIGWTKTFMRTYLTAFSGSVITFFCGIVGLSFFVPTENLFMAGVLPFLPGDLIKTVLAASLAHKLQTSMEKK